MLFFERTPYRRTAMDVAQIDESHALSGNGVELHVLTHADNHALYNLYAELAAYDGSSESAIQPDETAECFTKRVVSMCEMLWTIRLTDNPGTVVGDCALHHWNRETREIEFGGSLAPSYWGNGIIGAAFQLVATFAKKSYDITAMRCSTSSSNYPACRFAEKMGFDPLLPSGNHIRLFRKAL